MQNFRFNSTVVMAGIAYIVAAVIWGATLQSRVATLESDSSERTVLFQRFLGVDEKVNGIDRRLERIENKIDHFSSRNLEDR